MGRRGGEPGRAGGVRRRPAGLPRSARLLGCQSESEASWGAVFAELKRRTRVVRIFPNVVSCLRLVSALLIETIQQWMGRLYLRMEQDTATATHATAA